MPLIISPRQLTQRAQFYQQWAQMLAAGVPMISALDMISRNAPSSSYREPIRRILGQISQGGTLSDAMRHLGSWTPTFDLAMIDAGEQSGRLDVVFRMLANHYNERAAMLRQMITDLAYPAFVFHMAIFIFPFIAWFQGGTLTGFLLKTVGVLALLYAGVFLMIYSAQARRGEGWRSFLEKLLRPVPVLGTARHSLALARLAAALEALLNAGVRIIEAWELAAAASGSPAIQRTVLAWRPRVANGMTPSEVVNASPQFPDVFRNLYHTGEMSGQLDETLRRLHAYYQDEGTRKMHLVSQWVPRMIYLGVAGLVAFKVIGFYTDYFNEVRKAGGF